MMSAVSVLDVNGPYRCHVDKAGTERALTNGNAIPLQYNNNNNNPGHNHNRRRARSMIKAREERTYNESRLLLFPRSSSMENLPVPLRIHHRI